MSATDSQGPSEVTSGRLLRNTLANGGANAANALVTLALTPLLLHRLGPRQYGVWLLALSVTFSSGYLALADLGLPQASVRFIAEARATGSSEKINTIASTTIAFFLVVGTIVGLAVAALASTFVSLLGPVGDLARPAREVFVLVGLSIVVDLPAAGLLAVIEGTQHYSRLRAIDVGGRLLWGGAVVAAVEDGHGVVALAAASLGASLLEAAGALVIAHRVQPSLRLGPSLVDRRTLRETMSFGSMVALMQGLSVVYAQMDRVIIGIAIGAAVVANYEVAYRLQSVATLVMVMSYSAVLPAAAYNAAREESAKQRELFLRGTKYAVALILPPTLATMVFARPLIVTWVGSAYASMAGPARLFLIYPLFGCLNQVGIAMLSGLGRLGRVITIQAGAVAVNLALSIILVGPLGISGVILGTLVGNGLAFLPYTALLLSTFQVHTTTWIRRIVLPNLLAVIVQLCAELALLHWATGLHQFWQIILLCVASCAIGLSVFATVGLRSDERRHLLQRLRTG